MGVRYQIKAWQMSIHSSVGHPNPPIEHEPVYPFRTIKNRWGYNPSRFWERCVECGFKTAWCETDIRHYPKCIHTEKINDK